MLFNSFPFLLAFLPASLGLYLAAARWKGGRWRLHVLLVLSVVFYGWWDPRFVPLLLLSVGLNHAAARAFADTGRGAVVTGAIVLNLAVLALFKYTGFLADLGGRLGLGVPRLDVALPLGISFFTFHHVMYLTDLRRGAAPRFDLVRYGLYIAFFPQVLAGPLVRWSEIMHQLEADPRRDGFHERLGRGLILLTLGLAKKVLVGDPLAAYANPVFAAAAKGEPLATAEAWQGVLAFALQIYFDFSGYTDMALGIALLFGIALPQNFAVPYRATSLQEFWRRWHMTLSRFLRDYLYVPLGGNRRGLAVQLGALMATMTLGGLWHGAGLTFVAWGVGHGAGLAAGLLWRRVGLRMPAALGWVLTLTLVVGLWVLFRAPSFEAAQRVYAAMLGFGTPGVEPVKWRMLVLGGLLATLGPTAHDLAHRARPSRALAYALAGLLVVLLLKIGDDENYEFIYFQF